MENCLNEDGHGKEGNKTGLGELKDINRQSSTGLKIYLPGRPGLSRRRLERNEQVKYQDQLWNRAPGVHLCAAFQSSAALVESPTVREGKEGLSHRRDSSFHAPFMSLILSRSQPVPVLKTWTEIQAPALFGIQI